MTSKTKRLTAILLAVILCVSMIPFSALAEGHDNADASSAEETVSAVQEEICADESEAAESPAEGEDGEVGEVPAGEGESPEFGPVEGEDEPAQDEPLPEGEETVVKIPAPGKITLFSVGERGKLRNLYYCFSPDEIIHMDSIGDICGMPAHSIMLSDGKTMKAAYCLNQDRGATDFNGYTWESTANTATNDIIGTIIAVGFQHTSQPTNDPPTPWGRGDSNDKWAVTQILVWAAINGHIKLGSDHLIHIDAVVDTDMARVAPHASNPSGFSSYYQQVRTKLLNFRQIPSFASYPSETNKKLGATAAKVINLKWDGSAYTATVTDKNGVLSNYNFRGKLPDGISVSISGNSMTLSSADEIPVAVTSGTATYLPQGGSGAVACWRTTSGDTSQQDFAVYVDGYDPVNAVITVATSGVPSGEAKLLKTSEDGIVDGLTFSITGSDGKSYTRTTSGGGVIDLAGIPIYEEEPVLDEEGNPMQDELTGEDLVTKGDTITYTATEVSVPIRYVIPSSQTFQLTEGGETTISFENRLKKWRVTVTKTDRETGAVAQGDATLAGAVYGIYHNGVLQDTYTTDSSGGFTSRYYVCGTGWTLKEITPSEGYLLNQETVTVGLSPYDTTIEYNNTSKGVKEQVIKGRIAITKHTDDGSTQIETPETGAEFQVYLSSSGSYVSAKATERDTITIGANGYAETKLLPYGMYTVHQTKGWEGKEKITDFQVFIAEDGKTYSFIINNRVFEALIQIVKKDAETGRTIPCSGVGFKIKDLTSGKWVSQHINYPTPMDISIFYTDVTGRLMLPSPLTYGSYQLVEQQSAYGYVLNGEPVPFTVDGTAKTITVELGNTPQKGQVSVHKTGEIFQSVKNVSGRYIPVYEETGLAGAVYAMYAEEDVKTGDGTLRYSAGELIEKVQTGTDGRATFPKVYLGKYRVVEETAPYGFVLDPTVYHVEFTYAGQTVTLQTELLECYDQRQKVDISLAKSLEQDETYGVGMNGEYANIRFGLYAAEGLTAADGRRIPKDGLLETISLNAALKGTFTADLPLGSYYVQETATDGHYILNDRKFPVVFSYGGQNKSTVRLEVDDGTPIENDLKRGRLQGVKSDEDGLLLEGAVFGLFREDGDTPIVTATSAANGEFSFEDIPVGTWYLREISTPDPYVLDEDVYEVEITEDGQVVAFDLVNWFKLGNVTLTKVDADYPDNKLTGAEFTVYADSDGDKLFGKSDVEIGKLAESEAGVYGMEDIRYGGYFVVETAAPDHFILDETPMYFEIREDGETVTVSAEGECVLNQAQTGNLKIVKKSEDHRVAGIKFLVTGEALTGQSFEGTFTTDEKGEILIEDLRIGSYTVTEVATGATVRYVLPTDQTLELTYGETVTAEFYNRLKRGSIFGQKLDMDGNPLEGVVFGLFHAGTEKFTIRHAIATAQTDENGRFAFHRVIYGGYIVAELETLPGYILNVQPIPVWIVADGQHVVISSIVNDHTKVLISKTDMTTGKELSGAKLQLLDKDKKLIEEWVSSEEPHLIEKLPTGKYFLHEGTAPDGYIVAEDVEFIVEETGDIQKVEMKDDFTRVEISKTDMTTGKELPGAKLQLFDKDDKLIEEWTSGDKPHMIEKLIPGEYRLHEEIAPAGYTKAEDVKFTVKPTGEIQKVVMKDAPIPDVPNTGEDNTLIWVSGLFFFSLAGAWVVCLVLRRIRRKENDR